MSHPLSSFFSSLRNSCSCTWSSSTSRKEDNHGFSRNGSNGRSRIPSGNVPGSHEGTFGRSVSNKHGNLFFFLLPFELDFDSWTLSDVPSWREECLGKGVFQDLSPKDFSILTRVSCFFLFSGYRSREEEKKQAKSASRKEYSERTKADRDGNSASASVDGDVEDEEMADGDQNDDEEMKE